MSQGVRPLWFALLLAAPAWGNDHRGSLGLTVASGPEYVQAVAIDGVSDRGARLPLEVGGTFAASDHLEFTLAARLAPPLVLTHGTAWGVLGGVRTGKRFGEDFRTWLGLQLAFQGAPFLTAGGRFAFGAQYDFLPVMGAYVELGGQVSGGAALRLSFEGVVGLQFRTYLFE